MDNRRIAPFGRNILRLHRIGNREQKLLAVSVVIDVVKGRRVWGWDAMYSHIVKRRGPNKVWGEAGHDTRPSPQIVRGDRAISRRPANGVTARCYILNHVSDDKVINGLFVCQLFDTEGEYLCEPGNDLLSSKASWVVRWLGEPPNHLTT